MRIDSGSSCTVPERGTDYLLRFHIFPGLLLDGNRSDHGEAHCGTPGPTAHRRKNDDLTLDDWLTELMANGVSFRAPVPGACMRQSEAKCTTTLLARSKHTGT